MTDYSKMSDFEINEAVSMTMLKESENPDAKYVAIGNYCNDPADAWSIVVENKISIDHLGKEIWGAKAFVPNGEPRPRYAEKNPLRAAMIVFLMMKEAGK